MPIFQASISCTCYTVHEMKLAKGNHLASSPEQTPFLNSKKHMHKRWNQQNANKAVIFMITYGIGLADIVQRPNHKFQLGLDLASKTS